MGKVWPSGRGEPEPGPPGAGACGSLRGWSRDTSNRGLRPPLRLACLLPPGEVLLDYVDGGEGEGAAGNTWVSVALFFLKRQKTPLSDLPWPPPEQGKERTILPFPRPGEEKGLEREGNGLRSPSRTGPPAQPGPRPPWGLAGFSVWAAAPGLPVPFLRGELGPGCPPQPVPGWAARRRLLGSEGQRPPSER